jgi:hypothetical protein
MNRMIKVAAIFASVIILAWAMPEPPKKSIIHSGTEVITIDGPYLLYRGDSLFVHYIDSANKKITLRSSQWSLAEKDKVQLEINSDEPGKTFTVKLKQKHVPEKSVYGKAKKMMVISDIEGNFQAMRKLLQGNGIMDDAFRWTFGDGHLVLVGDFVDRGMMVTEVLWLIYSLESQAEASGGKVHFVLGNHEVMNMNGDFNYVQPRYMAHADSMKVSYLSLFGAQSELGRWMASKNVSERIGNVLFTHGGYSTYMNLVQMDLKKINDTARLYYTDTSYNYPGIYSELIFSEDGPFWYRGYYHGEKRASKEQVDSTLTFYDCRYIVTGHTVVAKEISSFFQGKVINVDMAHSKGYSEGLWIENNKFLRVNAGGEKKEINLVY